MRKLPQFSIIMPTHNRAFCINNAIDSMLAQSYSHFELLIIDDGSTDGTQEQIEKDYAQELSSGKIVFYRFAEHVGVCKARNKGLDLAKNQWIGYIDSDNKVLEDFLLIFAEAINKTKAQAYYAQSKLDIDGSLVGRTFNHKSLWLKNFIDMGIFVHSQLVVKKLGGFDENMTRVVDWELAVRYTKVFRPVFIEKIVLHYNDSQGHVRITNSVDGKANWDYFFKKHMYPQPSKQRQNALGIIRYSCNCLAGYNVDVMNEDYLEYRYKIFKEITLKSLNVQTNQKFNIILLHSANLPEHHKLKFLYLEHLNPILTNVYIEDGQSINSAIKDAMSKLIKGKSIVTFRLDNDDALSKDFVKNIKKYAKSKYHNQAITMPDISVVQRVEEDKYLYVSKQYISNAIGLAYVSATEQLKSVMELGHHGKVSEVVPLLVDPTCGGLQTINGENCCNKIKSKDKVRELSLGKLNKVLSPNFPKVKLSVLRVINKAS